MESQEYKNYTEKHVKKILELDRDITIKWILMIVAKNR